MPLYRPTLAKACPRREEARNNRKLTLALGLYGLLLSSGTFRPKLLRFFFLAAPLVISLLAGTPAHAQDKTAEIDKIFSAITPSTPGCVCAVSKDGKLVANRAYGLADVEKNIPLTPGTTFDIGSVRKQFIAAAVLLLVEDKRLSLTDDVRKYFPALPNYGRTLTVDHMLTHTSGLRDWTGILPMTDGNTDVLTLILRQQGLNFAPGEEWAYSNSGYVLLAEMVARVSGMPFAEFAQKRLFGPLGMKSTAYVSDILQGTGDRAIGYQKDGAGWKQYMRLGNERGGGAIISTAEDLLAWNNALASGKLGAFVTAKLQEPATLNNGRKLTYARGLNVNDYPGAKLVSHSGGAAGYSAWLGGLPEHGLSVAVLCNFDPVSATELAHKVADQFLPPDTARAKGPATTVKGIDVPAADLATRAGLYFSEATGEPLRLGVANGRLSIGGGPALVPVAANRFRNPRGSLFFRSGDEFELHFTSPDAFELKSMEGQVTRYSRAQPPAYNEADLQAFAGRYQSEDLGSVFEIVPGTNALVMRFERAPEKAIELAPAAPDTWMRSMMVVRFRRDAGGKITGFVYSNPVARNISFTRLGDRSSQP
ncbi:MAG TPA: serine hydrolase domain-containing protein [Chitinophagaceae bacterium]